MIGIIYYGAGNLFSLKEALNRLEVPYEILYRAPIEIEKYDRFIIPGVGHAGTAMQRLKNSGLVNDVLALRKPVLGICVGMQLMTQFSEEGHVQLLDIVPLKTKRFLSEVSGKVPHVGWNQVKVSVEHPLFTGLSTEPYFYFVHSYYIEYSDSYTIAACDYGVKFSAVFQKNNFYGVQFHPEKSGVAGIRLLDNFCNLI